MIRSPAAAAVAALSITLCGCAATSRSTQTPPAAPAQSARSIPPGAADPSAQAAARMVDHALTMVGQPYRYGGANPGGFDCSGLVLYAAKESGIRVPRTAREQLLAGIPVARGDLRAGDLVFMHLAHKELHVGIAIGDERFVHAPAAGGHVRVDSLAAPPYLQGFIAARRVGAASQ